MIFPYRLYQKKVSTLKTPIFLGLYCRYLGLRYLVKKMRILAFICHGWLSTTLLKSLSQNWKLQDCKIPIQIGKYNYLYPYLCMEFFKKLLFTYHYQYPSIIDVTFWTLLIGKRARTGIIGSYDISLGFPWLMNLGMDSAATLAFRKSLNQKDITINNIWLLLRPLTR